MRWSLEEQEEGGRGGGGRDEGKRATTTTRLLSLVGVRFIDSTGTARKGTAEAKQADRQTDRQAEK